MKSLCEVSCWTGAGLWRNSQTNLLFHYSQHKTQIHLRTSVILLCRVCYGQETPCRKIGWTLFVCIGENMYHYAVKRVWKIYAPDAKRLVERSKVESFGYLTNCVPCSPSLLVYLVRRFATCDVRQPITCSIIHISVQQGRHYKRYKPTEDWVSWSDSAALSRYFHPTFQRFAVRMTVNCQVWWQRFLLSSGWRAAHRSAHMLKRSNLKFEHWGLTSSSCFIGWNILDGISYRQQLVT